MSRLARNSRRPDFVEYHSDVQFDSSHAPVFVRAVFPIRDPRINIRTMGVRFTSPEELFTFTEKLIEEAVKIWPEHPLIKYYLEDS